MFPRLSLAKFNLRIMEDARSMRSRSDISDGTKKKNTLKKSDKIRHIFEECSHAVATVRSTRSMSNGMSHHSDRLQTILSAQRQKFQGNQPAYNCKGRNGAE